MDDTTLHTERTRIDKLPRAHFLPLFAFLPRLREPFIGDPGSFEPDADGRWELRPPQSADLDAFTMCCYDLGLVVPHDWQVFVQAQPFHQDHALIATFGLFQCCQALSAVIRGDRFNIGLAEELWNNGTLARLVERLQEVFG